MSGTTEDNNNKKTDEDNVTPVQFNTHHSHFIVQVILPILPYPVKKWRLSHAEN